jgi:hypothetical protein
MTFDQEQIVSIFLQLDQKSNNFVSFLSSQELDRVAEIIRKAIFKHDRSQKVVGEKDFYSWAFNVKNLVTSDLNETQKFFLIKDIAMRLPIDDFLNVYYQKIQD